MTTDKGSFSFCRSVSHRQPKNIVAPPLLLSSPQPSYVIRIVASLNDNNHLIVVANSSVLMKAKKKIHNARLWMRFDQSG